MSKRIFAFLLCLILAAEMMPPSVFAAAYPSVEKLESDEIIVKEDGSKSRLVKTVIYPAYDYTKVIDGTLHYFLKKNETVTEEVSVEGHYDVWHSSSADIGWKISDTGVTVPDEDLEKDGITGYLENVISPVIDLTAKIPENVQLALKEDRFIKAEVYPANGMGDKLINTSKTEVASLSAGDTSLDFTIIPHFELADTETMLVNYGRLLDGPDNIYIIDESRGYNLWAIYQNGVSCGQAEAVFDYSKINAGGGSKKGYADFSYIADEEGNLVSGKTIKTSLKGNIKSAGAAIGDGTYKSAGALGYEFRYIMTAAFTYTVNKDIDVTDQIKYVQIETPLTVPEDTKYTLTYSPGEGTGVMDPVTATVGSLIVLKDNEFTAPEGKIFTGYKSSEDGEIYQPGDSIAITMDTEMTAQWADEDKPLPSNPDEITVNAVLDLPEVSYEGHQVFATDESVIKIGGEEVSLNRAYSDGSASNNFTAEGANTKERQGKTTLKLIYDKKGTYTVDLDVKAGSSKDSDSKTIDILRTPYINAVLGGSQKENRKQTLDVVVAQNPKYPVTSLVIEITEQDSGETITVTKNFKGSEAAPKNSDHIKYRSLINKDSDEYNLRVELDFLSKFTEERTFEYRITSKDSRGNTDTKEAEFTVVPDLAPQAAIKLNDQYIREIGSNTAKITASDASITDGDSLERTWQVSIAGNGKYSALKSIAGFKDMSFGSLHSIGFDKTGVGPFSVKLTVKDIWAEETLEEYITAADYKSSEAEASSHVDNIAPEVLLSLKKAKTAEILIIAATDSRKTSAEGKAAELKAALLKDNISAEIFTARSSENDAANIKSNKWSVLTEWQSALPKDEGSTAKLSYVLDTATSAFWGNGMGASRKSNTLSGKAVYTYTLDANGSTVVDEGYIYRMTSTVKFSDSTTSVNYYDRTYPFYLECYDAIAKGTAKTPALKWKTAISKSVFNSADLFKNAKIISGTGSPYIFLISNGKTLILDKETGAVLKLISFEMGDFSCVSDGDIYTVKSDGIYSVSSSSGAAKKEVALVIQAGFEKSVLLNNAIHFVYEKDGKLYRGIYELSSRTLRSLALDESEPAADLEGLKGQCIGIDSNGRIIIYYETGRVKYYEKGSSKAAVISKNESLVTCSKSVTPTVDAYGRMNYVVECYEGRDMGDAYIRVYDLKKNRVVSSTQYVSETDPCGILAARAIEYPASNIEITYGPSTASSYIRENGTSAAKDPEFTIDADMSLSNPVFEQTITKNNSRFLDRDFALDFIKECYPGYSYVKMTVLPSAKDNAEEILKDRYLTNTADYTYVLDASEVSKVSQAAAKIKDEGENLASLELTSDTKEGQLSAAVTLDPSKTYYYEYDTDQTKDIFIARDTQKRFVSASTPAYKVTAQYSEDFSGNSSGFFTYDENLVGYTTSAVKSGTKTVASAYQPFWGYGAVKGDEGKITFTVPEGKKAVLSFTYLTHVSSSDPVITLEKQGAWEHLSSYASSHMGYDSGIHIWDEILDGGTYTLKHTFTGSNQELGIGTINLYIVEATTEKVKTGTVALASQSTVVQEEGGMNHVSGSFTSPSDILAFESYDKAVFESETSSGKRISISTSKQYSKDNKSGTYQSVTVTEPSGEKIVYLSVTADASYSPAANSRYSDSIYYTVDNLRYEEPDDPEDDATYYDDRYYIKPAKGAGYEKDFTFRLKGQDVRYQGYSSIALRITGHVPSYSKYGALNANFKNVTAAAVPSADMPSLITEDKYLISGNKLLLANVSGSPRVDLVFKPGAAGKAKISNFRLYYIENGVRIYVAEAGFNEESCLTAWKAANGSASLVVTASEEELQQSRVYRKGETVVYNFVYYDFEADPEKEGFFRYTHEPMNDGLNPMSGQILDAPISKFYIDGKYTVEHWVYDDASRGSGNHDYDKMSNTATAVFYVMGEPEKENTAPWVESIATNLKSLEEGDDYTITVKVDDEDKDELTVKIEIYFEEGSTPFYTKTRRKLDPAAGGKYPAIILDDLPPAEEGVYEVVATVSDGKSSGIKSYTYVAGEKKSLTGIVYHTDAWEANRQDYNSRRFKDKAVNYVADFAKYKKQTAPRKRGTNVFWTGESLQLIANVAGKVSSVTAKMDGTKYSTTLKKEKDGTFTGALWNEAMQNGFAKNGPEEKTITFTARYIDGTVLTYSVKIIFDDDELYWNLHRAY